MGYIRIKDDVYDEEHIIFPQNIERILIMPPENGYYGLKLYNSSNHIMLVFSNEEKLNKVVEGIIEIKEKNNTNKSAYLLNGF